MKYPKRSLAPSLIALVSLLACLCVYAIAPIGVDAVSNSSSHSKGKRSKEEKISASFAASDSVRSIQVILQLNQPPSPKLNAVLRRAGVRIKADFKELRSLVVELPLSVIDELSEFEEVEFVSPDREVQLLGHVDQTTGAAFMRTQSGNSAIKGKDTNIAIMDSGIDKDHHEIGSRVDAQLDFTGEGRFDDPYGHGTHVASLAAGVGHVSHGSYTGVAPEAKIINLRVLNESGVGTVSNVIAALNWLLAPSDPNKPLGEKNFQKFKIRVVNLSLGAPAVDSYKNDPLCVAARRLVNAGIVVVATP